MSSLLCGCVGRSRGLDFRRLDFNFRLHWRRSSKRVALVTDYVNGFAEQINVQVDGGAEFLWLIEVKFRLSVAPVFDLEILELKS
jgi:hypothetical protein